MNNCSKVSVVIPLYNKEKHIIRAVNSVISQTHQSFEIIIINDGSTDGGLAKAEDIADKRVRIITQNNSGESAARNKGINEAKNNLIAFLDADDQWEPECLEHLVRLTEKYPEVGMAGVNYKIISHDEELIYPEFRFTLPDEGIVDNYFKLAVEKPLITASSVIVRKEVFNKLGGFTAGMHYLPDHFMWSKIALNYYIAYYNKYLATIYQNAENRILNKFEIVNDFPLFEYIKDLDIEIDGELYYYIKEYTYRKYLSIARRYLITGDLKNAKAFISGAKETELFRDRYLRRRKKYARHKMSLFFPKRVVNFLYPKGEK